MKWFRDVLDRLMPNNTARVARAYKRVASGRDGSIVFADLMKFAELDMDPFVPGDPHTTNYNLGKQRVGLRIRAFVERPLREYAAENHDPLEEDEDETLAQEPVDVAA